MPIETMQAGMQDAYPAGTAPHRRAAPATSDTEMEKRYAGSTSPKHDISALRDRFGVKLRGQCR